MNILSQGRRVGVPGVVWSRSRITYTYKTFYKTFECLSCNTSVGGIAKVNGAFVSSEQFIEAMLTLFKGAMS